MKTLHIHIGTPKTATTAIQKFCADNNPVLNRKGYCYPDFSFDYGRVGKARNGHFLIGFLYDEDGNRCVDKEMQRISEVMQKIEELFLTYDHVILSDEDIWRFMDEDRTDLWKILKAEADRVGYQVHMIVYFRRQDQFLTSNWNQNVKGRIGTLCEELFDDFLEKVDKDVRLNYYEKLERVAAVIGKENITVRRFDKSKFVNGSIHSDFLSVIGLAMTDEYQITKGIWNLSLYGNTHEIKRAVNSLPALGDPGAQKFIKNRLMEFSNVSSKQYPCEMFSKEEAEAFLKNYEEGNRKVAEEYLHEPGGELFDLTVNDTEKWQKNNRYMDEDLARFTASVGVYLQKEYEDLKKENDALKKEVNRLKRDVEELFQFRENAKHPFRTMLSHIKRRFKKGN